MDYLLTKSKFILGQQCEKALYLNVYKPKLAYYSPETLTKFRQGRDFEAKVKALFPNGIDISQRLGRRMNQYAWLTRELLSQEGAVTLYEAGFVFNQVLVLADVVQKKADGTINVFEIKNSLSVKDVFRNDVSIQHYVIANNLPSINSFQIIYNDGNDNPLFEDLLSYAREAELLIAKQIEHFKEVLQGFEPSTPVDEHCLTPYECPFLRYCKNLLQQ